MIEKMDATYQRTAGVRIEFSPRFLAPGYGRKLYVVEEGQRLRIPTSGKAHIHSNPDYLVPLVGEIVLAYKCPNGEVKQTRLEAGYHYRIPPLLPHQVEIRGGILESFYPTAAYEARIPTLESNEDLLARAK